MALNQLENAIKNNILWYYCSQDQASNLHDHSLQILEKWSKVVYGALVRRRLSLGLPVLIYGGDAVPVYEDVPERLLCLAAHPESASEKEDVELTELIKTAFAKSRATSMALAGLLYKTKRKFKATTNSSMISRQRICGPSWSTTRY